MPLASVWCLHDRENPILAYATFVSHITPQISVCGLPYLHFVFGWCMSSLCSCSLDYHISHGTHTMSLTRVWHLHDCDNPRLAYVTSFVDITPWICVCCLSCSNCLFSSVCSLMPLPTPYQHYPLSLLSVVRIALALSPLFPFLPILSPFLECWCCYPYPTQGKLLTLVM